jgi:hypothetical protein
MTQPDLHKVIEAILYVTGEPVALGDLARALEATQLEVLGAVELLENHPCHLSLLRNNMLRVPFPFSIFNLISNFITIKPNYTFLKLFKQIYTSYQGTFSGSAHADNAIYITVFNRQINIIYCHEISVFRTEKLRQMFNFNHSAAFLLLSCPSSHRLCGRQV